MPDETDQEAATSPEATTTGEAVVPAEADDAKGLVEPQPQAGASLPGPVEAILKTLPEEEQGKFRSVVSTMLQFSGPAPNPLIDKITSEHLTKIIDGSEKQSERVAVDRRESRGHTRFLVVAGMVTFLIASGIFLWGGQPQLLTTLVQFGIVFAGGLGAGAGFLKSRSK